MTDLSANASTDGTRGSLFDQLKDSETGPGAWEVFDRRYSGLLMAFAHRLEASSELAEEIKQRVLIAFHRRLPEFQYDRTKGRFRSYLKVCVRHELANYRKRLRLNGVSLEDVNLEGKELDEAWSREEEHTRLYDAMRRVRTGRELAGRDLIFLEDSVIGRLTVAQIAERHGATPAAVEKAIQRVKKELDEELSKMDANDW